MYYSPVKTVCLIQSKLKTEDSKLLCAFKKKKKVIKFTSHTSFNSGFIRTATLWTLGTGCCWACPSVSSCCCWHGCGSPGSSLAQSEWHHTICSANRLISVFLFYLIRAHHAVVPPSAAFCFIPHVSALSCVFLVFFYYHSFLSHFLSILCVIAARFFNSKNMCLKGSVNMKIGEQSTNHFWSFAAKQRRSWSRWGIVLKPTALQEERNSFEKTLFTPSK